MTPFERLKTLVEFNLSDAVQEENVDMTFYFNENFHDKMTGCMTSGCRAGWGTQCKTLQDEGYRMAPKDRKLMINDLVLSSGHQSLHFLQFFGLTPLSSQAFFDDSHSGSKEELKKTWAAYLKSNPTIS